MSTPETTDKPTIRQCPVCKGSGKRDSRHAIGRMTVMLGDTVAVEKAGTGNSYSIKNEWKCQVCDGKGTVGHG